MEHRIGSLAAKEDLQLYMARIDCYLISVAEIPIDIDAHSVEGHLFFRQLVGINSRAMLAVLFTENSLIPIHIRRLLLALSQLRYMLELSEERRVRAALLNSVDLFATGHPGWAGDIAILLRSLSMPIQITPQDFRSLPAIEAISKRVVEVVDADLQFDINFL
ncbi:hypothetical protein B0H13DRAFT_1641616 [Mycena leptocephala]|nr:hypothetical protein B0H13DRAFT_1641616 [Mycena leptocephala]